VNGSWQIEDPKGRASAGKTELRGDHFNAGRKTEFVEKCQSKAKG